MAVARIQHQLASVVLRGADSNRCVDDATGSQANGAWTQICDRDGGANQQWSCPSGNQLLMYDTCLDACNSQATQDTEVLIWSCNGTPNQRRRLNSDGTIIGVQSGPCLDVLGNGALSQLWTCNGGSNQKWNCGWAAKA
jgi:alpha-galactosidase